MKCPHCFKELDIPDVVYLNAATYHQTNLIVTNCCENPVLVRPIIRFEVTKYEGKETQDYWGNPINKFNWNKNKNKKL